MSQNLLFADFAPIVFVFCDVTRNHSDVTRCPSDAITGTSTEVWRSEATLEGRRLVVKTIKPFFLCY
jgi:hypothetical protein